MSAQALAESLLTTASNDLAVKHQERADKQARGRNLTAATEALSKAFDRVEALEAGVTFKQPPSQRERQIAELAAEIVVMMLNGEEAGKEFAPQIVETLDSIAGLLPDEDTKRRTFLVYRQGRPERNGRGPEPTQAFDLMRKVRAGSYREAIERAIEKGEGMGPGTEWPEVADGEVVTVIELAHRSLNQDRIWVERIERPLYVGSAPRDNSEDPHCQ